MIKEWIQKARSALRNRMIVVALSAAVTAVLVEQGAPRWAVEAANQIIRTLAEPPGGGTP